MNKKLIGLCGVGLTTLLCTVNALADSSPQGFYLGADLGYSGVKQTVSNPPATKQKNTGFGFDVLGGYSFNQYLGAELGYTEFANASYGNGITSKNNYAIDVAAKGTMPLEGGFSLFGKLGLASVHHKLNVPAGTTPAVSNTGSFSRYAPYLGAGASYQVSENVAANLQVTGTTKQGPVPGMYLVAAGLTFNFQ